MRTFMPCSTLFVLSMWTACASSHRGHRGESDRSDPGGDVYYEGGGPFPAVSEQTYAAQTAEVLAVEPEHCCEQVGLGAREDTDDYLAELMPRLAPPDPASGAEFNPAAAAACLALTKERGCSLLKDVSARPDACRAVYAGGKRKPGERCRSEWDCAAQGPSGSHGSCLWAQGESQGTCVSARTLQEGERCDSEVRNELTSCDPALLCNDRSGLCVRRARLGETCLTGVIWGDTCESGAVCDRRGTKRCVKPKAVGEPCEALEECDGLACVAGTCREPLATVTLCE
jgi:hypothetical protein